MIKFISYLNRQKKGKIGETITPLIKCIDNTLTQYETTARRISRRKPPKDVSHLFKGKFFLKSKSSRVSLREGASLISNFEYSEARLDPKLFDSRKKFKKKNMLEFMVDYKNKRNNDLNEAMLNAADSLNECVQVMSNEAKHRSSLLREE